VLWNQLDAIIGEPFFSTSLFPWNSLHFWYASSKLQASFDSDVKIMPIGATLKGIAVQFKDLWKYHSPVNWVEGFDLTLFDELIQVLLRIPQTQSSRLFKNYKDIMNLVQVGCSKLKGLFVEVTMCRYKKNYDDFI